MKKSKSGQVGLTQIALGFVVLCVILIGLFSLLAYSRSGGNVASSFEQGINEFSDLFYTVLGPLFTILLGLGNDANINFLIILSFILVMVIVVSTLDSVNIFGDNKNAGLINFAVGTIVTLIGVRFMPQDIWVSLTAPSSALVATLLVGVPFFAFFFITIKIKFPLARKLLWLFFVIFMSYLIFYPVGGGRTAIGGPLNDFAWVYIVFLGLGVLMLFTEGLVRRYVFRETAKMALGKSLGIDYTKRIADIRGELSELISQQGKLKGAGSTKLKAVLQAEINRLKKEYTDITGEII